MSCLQPVTQQGCQLRTQTMKCLCWALNSSQRAVNLATLAMSLAGAVWRVPCSAAPVHQRPRRPDSSTGPSKPSSGGAPTANRAGAATAGYQCHMVPPGPASKCPCAAAATSTCTPSAASSCRSVSIGPCRGPGHCNQWRESVS